MSTQWSKVSTADNDLMAQYSALSKPRFSKSAGAVLGRGSYSKAAMRGLGMENYSRAALRGLGRENYTRAALRGLGRENYTRAVMRGMGGKRTCGSGKVLDFFKKFIPPSVKRKAKQVIEKVNPRLKKFKNGVENVLTTILPALGSDLIKVAFTVLGNTIDGKQQTDAQITKQFADVVIKAGKQTLEESKKEIEKQLSAPNPEPEAMEVDQEPIKTGPPKKPLPIPDEKLSEKPSENPSENLEQVPIKVAKRRAKGLVPNFKNYDEFEAYLNSI